jgi:hypothetical protein
MRTLESGRLSAHLPINRVFGRPLPYFPGGPIVHAQVGAQASGSADAMTASSRSRLAAGHKAFMS